MLQGLGMDAATRIDWYKRHAGAAGRESGGEYRALKSSLRRALGDPARWLSDRPSGTAVQGALDQRRERLSTIAARLRELSDGQRLTQTLDSLASSYVHLQLNRLGAARSEQILLGILLRTLESLAKAPAR
jgi:thiopeptide-type bacteriocin biosynthesis protein